MLRKIVQRGKYIAAELIGAAIYGVLLYFTFTWLTGYSPLYAYFGNLALMILFFAVEEYAIRTIEAKGIPKSAARREDREKVYRSFQRSIENNISFKTMLYLFYVLILIFSQVIDNNPSLVSDDLRGFVEANGYSILLLMAIDMLLNQISKEKERMKRLSAKLEKAMTENQG